MIKKVISYACLLVVLSILAGTFLLHQSAKAFNASNLMDDGVFDRTSTMSAADIDFWLNHYFGSSSCISPAHGFSAVDPIGYNPSQGFLYGGAVSAGQVIYDAAQAYEVNPQVLLATLEKEENLVTGSAGCPSWRYASAVGYGCPDGGASYNYSGLNPPLYYINGSAVDSISGTCVNDASRVGFTQQVIRAAWLLAFGRHRSEGNTGWAIIKGNWDNSDDPQTCYGGPMTQGNFKRCSSDSSTTFYDGYTVIDSQSTHMDTGITAALYWYTPHFSGNQSFDSLFQSWFGDLYNTYSAQPVWQSVFTDSSKT